MTTWKPLAALGVLLVSAGCSHQTVPYFPLSSSELGELVTDRTLYIPNCCDAPYGTLLFLAKGGTGWLDSRLKPGSPPLPGEMSIVLDWRVQEGSQICLWASPLIGEIPSLIPPLYRCLEVQRPVTVTDPLRVRIIGDTVKGRSWLTVYPYNAFPGPVIDQYMTQLKVLFGGRVPTWHAAEAMPPQPL